MESLQWVYMKEHCRNVLEFNNCCRTPTIAQSSLGFSNITMYFEALFYEGSVFGPLNLQAGKPQLLSLELFQYVQNISVLATLLWTAALELFSICSTVSVSLQKVVLCIELLTRVLEPFSLLGSGIAVPTQSSKVHHTHTSRMFSSKTFYNPHLLQLILSS